MDNLKPKKHLGQHFLRDTRICEQITNLIHANPDDSLIEIGPGEGVLTQFLTEKFNKLLLIEIDPEAVHYLQKRFAKRDIQIIHRDILTFDISGQLAKDSHFVGNLPYNISSPIFFLLLDHLSYVKEGVFMIQQEVAERICANPGSKTFGILSVLLGAYFHLDLAFTVPPSVFYPPPKVNSAVIRMARKEQLPDISFKQLKRVVKIAFQQRRKTLRNALKSLHFQPFEGMENLMTKRAEALSVDAFLTLAHHLHHP